MTTLFPCRCPSCKWKGRLSDECDQICPACGGTAYPTNNRSVKRKISKPVQAEWMSAAQVAELKGCTKSAVYMAISEGRLRSRTIAGRIVVHRMVAQAWDVQLHTGRPRKEKGDATASE